MKINAMNRESTKVKVENGNEVSVHYRGTLTNGTEFDNSRIRGAPLTFKVGAGKMIPGFDDALLGMALGDIKSINVPMEKAYGPRVDEAVQPVPKTSFGEGFEFIKGGLVQGKGPRGPFVARVQEIEDSHVILDFNHPLAGEDLNFEIEVLTVEEPSEQLPWKKSMKKADLLEIAQSSNLDVNTKSTKSQIIEALQTL
tara:strand:+ start:253 stop:846 length:594 start_codon:yes stop_codon:yes gene_type:complete